MLHFSFKILVFEIVLMLKSQQEIPVTLDIQNNLESFLQNCR